MEKADKETAQVIILPAGGDKNNIYQKKPTSRIDELNNFIDSDNNLNDRSEHVAHDKK